MHVDMMFLMMGGRLSYLVMESLGVFVVALDVSMSAICLFAIAAVSSPIWTRSASNRAGLVLSVWVSLGFCW